MARVRAGQLNRRITIERPVIETTASGAAQIVKYDRVARVWAQVIPDAGGESAEGAAVTSSTGYRVMIRRGVTVKARDRIIYGDEHLEVTSVHDADDDRVLTEIRAVARDRDADAAHPLEAAS